MSLPTKEGTIKKTLRYATALVALIGLAGCASTVPPVPEVYVPSADATVRPIAIQKVILQLPLGHQNGVVAVGLLCIPHGTLNAHAFNSTSEVALEIVREEFALNGYPVTNPPGDLFATPDDNPRAIRLAGRVVDVHDNVCFPMGGFGDLTNGSADSAVAIEWQVLDPASRTVVLKTTTTGVARIGSASQPLNLADTAAVRQSIRLFIASREFQALVRSTVPAG
jgi:hypothetical protein